MGPFLAHQTSPILAKSGSFWAGMKISGVQKNPQNSNIENQSEQKPLEWTDISMKITPISLKITEIKWFVIDHQALPINFPGILGQY